jgi:hypothetical protein
METIIRFLVKALDSSISEISQEAPLDIKALLSSVLDEAMSTEVTETLIEMTDLLTEGFS